MPEEQETQKKEEEKRKLFCERDGDIIEYYDAETDELVARLDLKNGIWKEFTDKNSLIESS